MTLESLARSTATTPTFLDSALLCFFNPNGDSFSHHRLYNEIQELNNADRQWFFQQFSQAGVRFWDND